MVFRPGQRRSRRRSCFLIATSLVVGAFAPAASGDDRSLIDTLSADDRAAFGVVQDDASVAATSSRYQVSVIAGVYLPRLKGDVRFGTGAGAGWLDTHRDLELRGRESVAHGELHVRKDDTFELVVSGLDFERDNSSDVFAPPSGSSFDFGPLSLDPGDTFSSTFALTTWAIDVHFMPFWRNPSSQRAIDAGDNGFRSFDSRFTLVVGARHVGLDHDLSIVGEGSVSVENTWLAPMGGLAFQATWHPENAPNWIDSVGAHVSMLGGPVFGSGSGTIVDVRAGLQVDFTELVGLEFGFRLVEMNVEDDDDWEFEGGLQGFFVAASIRF